MTEEEKLDIVENLIIFLKKDYKDELINIIKNSEIIFEETDYSFGFNYNTIQYELLLTLDIENYLNIKDNIESFERDILKYLYQVNRINDNYGFERVHIKYRNKKGSGVSFSNNLKNSDLIKEIYFLRDTLILVSTGKQKIQDIKDEYSKIYSEVEDKLRSESLPNPNQFKNLWNWYEYYKNNNLPTYESRRQYVFSMYSNLIDSINNISSSLGNDLVVNIDDWDRLKRTVVEIKKRFLDSKSEEQFQAIGQLCRDALISLAQMVYIREFEETNSTNISKTDAKGMLDYYISKELSGGKLESLRKLVYATNSFANCVTHDRNANQKDTHLCISSTISLINIVGILEGKF